MRPASRGMLGSSGGNPPMTSGGMARPNSGMRTGVPGTGNNNQINIELSN